MPARCKACLLLSQAGRLRGGSDLTPTTGMGAKGTAFMPALRQRSVGARQKAVQKRGESEAPASSRRIRAFGAAALRPGAGAGASGAAKRRAAEPQAGPDSATIKMVERAISLHHPYENRERLRRILPRRTSARSLDRALDILERSGKIAVDGEAIRWLAGPPNGPAVGGDAGAAANKSILAGTCFEWMEEDKLPTETIGEYVVRVYNAHEPGSYTDEDAREFNDGMRRMAKGDYYTHEQVWKMFGL